MTTQEIVSSGLPMFPDETAKAYGLKIIEPYRLIDPSEIKFNIEYQRTLEKHRLDSISRSVREYGYWMFEVIVLNEKLEAVDGQHRAKVAIDFGIEKVPVCIVSFTNKQMEAKFFVDRNNYNTTLKPIDFWHGRYLCNHPIATSLYAMQVDKKSLLYGRIALKNCASKIGRYQIFHILSFWSKMLTKHDHWSRRSEYLLTSKLQDLGYENLRFETNDFIRWVESCFGPKSNTPPYIIRIFKPIVRVYFILKTSNVHSKPDTISKMQQYVFTSELVKLSSDGIVLSMLSHYNKGKKDVNKISMEKAVL